MEQTVKNVYPTIEIGTKPKNGFQAVLKKLGISPSYRKYELTPILVGVRHEVSKVVVSIPDKMLVDGIENSVMNLHIEHLDKIIQIIGLGMVNNKKGPSKKLLKIIKKEFTVNDLHIAMQLVMVQLNMKSFIACLELIKGANVLQVPDIVKIQLPPGINEATDGLKGNEESN